jgi:signal transduction histidine kinase
VTIALLVADQRTEVEGLMIGAYTSLGILACVGVLFVVQPGLFAEGHVEEVTPTRDDLDRLMAHHVPTPIAAEPVTREQAQPAPSAPVSTELPRSWSRDDALGGARAVHNVGAEPAPLEVPLEVKQDTTVLPPSRAAEIFVNIGRRNKQLNRQMLTLISHLERDELDPEILQGLYELDHLATRMRRNEETLLMLASTRKVRQWSPPVKLEDVLRSSLAEVDRFARVELDHVPDVEVVGASVSEIAHLLAELIDNATEFSHASTLVTVSAHTTLEGVEIEVLDTGHGIDEKKMADLNELLSNPPALADAPSRRLGLFIASRIASQHSITVELDGQRGVGTVASVSLPHELIVETEDEREDDNESSLDALDLLDPVLQFAVGAELEEDEEDALATAALPTEQEVADALSSFPSVAIGEPSPLGAVDSTSFPGVLTGSDIEDVVEDPVEDLEVFAPDSSVPTGPAPLPSRIPQATFALVWGQTSSDADDTMPAPEVSTVSPDTPPVEEPFDEAVAERVAGDASTSIIAFTSGVARGVVDSAEEHTTDSTTDGEDS